MRAKLHNEEATIREKMKNLQKASENKMADTQRKMNLLQAENTRKAIQWSYWTFVAILGNFSGLVCANYSDVFFKNRLGPPWLVFIILLQTQEGAGGGQEERERGQREGRQERLALPWRLAKGHDLPQEAERQQQGTGRWQ